MLSRRGLEFARPLQRGVRDLMSECCGVVRAAGGLAAGLARLDELAERTAELEVRPDIAGFDDLAHAFDLHGSLLTARATLDCAIERRETRGAHNRADFPALDPEMRVNLVWTLDGSVTREYASLPSGAVAALVDGPAPEPAGRLLE